MGNKIRLMRKVFTIASSVVVIAALGLNGHYALMAGLIIGTLIGLAFRKKRPEPDDQDLQMELLANYIAAFVVISFLVVMMVRNMQLQMFANPYWQVLIVWLAAWAGSTFILKRVWK